METITLDAREQAHVKFALVYAQQFNHGTDGHLALTVIAKLAKMVARLENDIAMLQMDKVEVEPKRDFMD